MSHALPSTTLYYDAPSADVLPELPQHAADVGHSIRPETWTLGTEALGLAPGGRGVWLVATQRTLRQFAQALCANQPAELADEHVQARLAAIDAAIEAIECTAARTEALNPEVGRANPTGIYRDHPLHAALLHHTHRQAHCNDPDLALLAALYWRLAAHADQLSSTRWYAVMLAWRRLGRQRLARHLRRHLELAAAAYRAGDIAGHLGHARAEAKSGDKIGDHLGTLQHQFAHAPRHKRVGRRASQPTSTLARAITDTASRRVQQSDPDGGVELIAASDTGGDGVGGDASPPYLHVPPARGVPFETPAGRRRARRGATNAVARANNQVTANMTRPIAEAALQRLRERARLADAAIEVAFWVQLLLARRLDSTAVVALRDLDCDAGASSEALGAGEIAYSGSKGQIHIHRPSQTDGDDTAGWTLTLRAPATGPVIRAFERLLAPGAVTAIVDMAAAQACLVQPLALDIGTLAKKDVTRLSRVLDQRAREEGTVSPVVVDALFVHTGAGPESPHYYCHPDIPTLDAAYQNLVEALMHSLGWLDDEQPELALDVASGRAEARETSDPGLAALRSAARTTRATIRRAVRTRADKRASHARRIQARRQLDEAAAVYVWLQVGLACAVRGVTSPAPDWPAYSPANPLALLTDKDAHGRGEARVVGLPRPVRRTLSAYRDYRGQRGCLLGEFDEDARSLVVPCADDPSEPWQAVSPTWLAEVLPRYGLVDSRANALRHRAATWCAEQGLPAAVQRYWLSHFGPGLQPVGGYSSLAMQDVAASLARTAARLLRAVDAHEPLDALIDR